MWRIANFEALGPVALALAVRFLAAPTGQAPAMLGPVILAVAVMDYAAGLFVESQVLRSAGKMGSAERAAGVAAVVSGAFGASMSVYGIVLWMVGAGATWFWPPVALGVIYWAHLTARRERFEEVRRAAG
jgi:hypothetical protein